MGQWDVSAEKKRKKILDVNNHNKCFPTAVSLANSILGDYVFRCVPVELEGCPSGV